ncbi:MAG: META domain-containing protein [Burkholderiales bacterium]
MSVKPVAALFVAAALLSACGTDTSMRGAPSYDPASAAPPAVTAAAGELAGPTWQWQRIDYPDGRSVPAAKPESYTIRFEGGGRYFLQADCNRGGGAYEVAGGTMRMGPAALTRMACPQGSQDNAFVSALARAGGYAIVNGELRLTLVDGASMYFRR